MHNLSRFSGKLDGVSYNILDNHSAWLNRGLYLRNVWDSHCFAMF